MEKFNNEIMENFDEDNIHAVEEILNRDGLRYVNTTYTLVHRNSYCEVEVTDEGQQACVDSLLR